MRVAKKIAGGEGVSCSAPPHVLIADDGASLREMSAAALGRRGYRVSSRSSVEAALATASQEDVDVVLADGTRGMELCRRLAAAHPGLPVVVVAAAPGRPGAASAAIREGAYDFLVHPLDIEALCVSLDRAIRHRALAEEVRRLRGAMAAGGAAQRPELLGHSPKMKQIHDLLERVGGTDTTVLVTGESGTGKELVARALHVRSRPAGPFVVVNCAAIPEPLLESEFFGHARGAYTDARHARAGLFMKANGGTLFLDELGELPLSMQPKLLRALQERKIRHVGEDAEVPFDARIVASTNRDLEMEVAEKRFREDLYFRINVIHVELPPLRERGSDVLLLAQRFLQVHAGRLGKPVRGLSAEATERLVTYPWPGNVRELQNCIEHAVALARGEEIQANELPQKVRAGPGGDVLVAADAPGELVSLDEVERRYILRVLDAVHGNKAKAARVLRLDRTTLYRKLERYALSPRRPRRSK